MINQPDAKTLARMWIEGWIAGKPDDIPLADSFTHTSPFGRVEGREKYLAWVKPMAAENVVSLKIERIMGEGDEAAIHFIHETPKGPRPAVDWLVCKDGKILEIQSFYDAIELRD